MQPDAVLAKPGGRRWLDHIAPNWRAPLAHLALLWGTILLMAARDWATMAGQWWSISTYNHVLMVPAIIGGLVWIRRHELVKLTPKAWWPGLLGLAGALALWFLGRVGEINTFSQLGSVAALQCAVLALLGPRVAAALLFPLGYMLFLVPFGDELIPALQMITAKITIALTEWSGVPAHIEGVFIDTPAGLFEVAEACSGVKFLIAMIALGVLVAQTCFTSWARRAAFLAVCVIVPIVANGIRAWGTIYVAQSQGIEFAVGFDHIFYGWIFFALIVVMIMGGAWRFFDRSPEDPGVDGAAIAESKFLGRLDRFTVNPRGVLAACVGLVLAFAIWASLASRLEAQVPETISLPQVQGWSLVPYAPELHWEPRANGATHRLLGRYRARNGTEVDVFLAVYVTQRDGNEPSAPSQGALPPDTMWRWMSTDAADDAAKRDRLFALGRIRRTADTYYRHGDLLSGSATALKLATIQDRIMLNTPSTSMLILSSVEKPGSDPGAAIRAFRQSTGPLGPWIDRILESR